MSNLETKNDKLRAQISQARTQAFFEANTTIHDRVKAKNLEMTSHYSEAYLRALEMAQLALASRLTDKGKQRIQELVNEFRNIKLKDEKKFFDFMTKILPMKQPEDGKISS